MISDHHISRLPIVDGTGALIEELSEQDLKVRESGVDAGPYVMLLDSVIYLRNPLNWDKQVHQVLCTTVKDQMRRDAHSCTWSLACPGQPHSCMTEANNGYLSSKLMGSPWV